MAVDPDALRRHLNDYARVTGRRPDRFVCPITLRECEPTELIDGHIINGAIFSASRRTVIQYGDVDNFYGTRVEPSLVHYLNLPKRDPRDLLREAHDLRIRFADGSEVPAFVGGPEAAVKFPLIDLSKDGKIIASLYAKTRKDDPRLAGVSVEVSQTRFFTPSHWVAAMLKSAHLAMFEMLGYRAVFDPWGDHLRRCLARYYNDRAVREAATAYFESFRNATKFVFRAGAGKACAFDFDTLDDRVVLLHHTISGTMFAATCVFRVNDITVTVTVPQSTPGADVAAAVGHYDRLMADQGAVRQHVRQAAFKGDHWDVISEPLDITYLSDPPDALLRERL